MTSLFQTNAIMHLKYAFEFELALLHEKAFFLYLFSRRHNLASH